MPAEEASEKVMFILFITCSSLYMEKNK
jgi:hypothetical protein